MRHRMALVLAGGLLLGTASLSDAQVSVSIGNPYAGQGLYIGSGYGPGMPYPGYSLGSPVYGAGVPAYGLGYNSVYRTGYVGGYGPGGFGYGSGYRGFVGPVGGYGYGYGARPYLGGYGYGYRSYSRGYGPFRRFR